MAVNRHQLMDELELKLSNDAEAADEVAAFADYVKDTWQRIATQDLDAGYATGAYVASIKRIGTKRQHAKGTKNAAGKKIGGQFYWHHVVKTYSDIAHFLEYGTGPDNAPNYPLPPNQGGHWTDPQGGKHVWWNTPTPIFALAAKTEDEVAATASRLPKSKLARKRIADRGGEGPGGSP